MLNLHRLFFHLGEADVYWGRLKCTGAGAQIVMFDLGPTGKDGPTRKAECSDISKSAASCTGETT